MIETKNAIYLHSPKTGGTWVKEVLKPITLEWHEHKFLTSESDKPVYVFVRNPWSWHVSMYYFLQNGSEYYNPNSHTIKPPIIQALPIRHTFSTFVENITIANGEFKNLVYSIFRTRTKLYNDRADTAVVENQILLDWLSSPVSYYEHIYNTYTRYADKVGKIENLRNDLLLMVEECGDLTEEINHNIKNLPDINVTGLNTIKSYYDIKSKKLVENRCKQIIEKYDYRF